MDSFAPHELSVIFNSSIARFYKSFSTNNFVKQTDFARHK
jgi:hypothetical protein